MDSSDDEKQEPLYSELKKEGVILNTGDVVRLGRVCYIVKESSIDLGENAVKMIEEFATKQHESHWQQFVKQA